MGFLGHGFVDLLEDMELKLHDCGGPIFCHDLLFTDVTLLFFMSNAKIPSKCQMLKRADEVSSLLNIYSLIRRYISDLEILTSEQTCL